jgi:hypothetical protein
MRFYLSPALLILFVCTFTCDIAAVYAGGNVHHTTADGAASVGAADAATCADVLARTDTTNCTDAATLDNDADTEPQANVVNSQSSSQLPYKYVGNRYTHKFHRLSCPFAQAMANYNVEYFHFRKEAIEHGDKPCHWCLPPWWKSVSATIVGTTAENASTAKQATKDSKTDQR